MRKFPPRRSQDPHSRLRLAALAASVDVVFNPVDILGFNDLVALRAARLLQTPVVTVLHSPPFSRGGRRHRPAWRVLLRGSDAIPALSRPVADAVRRYRKDPGSVVVAPLGPDAAAYEPAEYPGEGVLSIGVTMRDHATLALAAAQAGVRCTIVCSRQTAWTLPTAAADLEVIVPSRGRLPHAEVRRLIAGARVVAIPLRQTRVLTGHWSLLDAMGMGKPVVMTRQPFEAIDVEKEGIGHSVDVGDVDGWTRHLKTLSDRPDEATAMGRRARALVDGGFNSASFADAVMDVFDRLLGICTR